MMKIEASGKSFDEALASGLKILGLEIDQVDVELIDEGSKGFLGIGAKPVRIEITAKEMPEDDDDLLDLDLSSPKAKPAPAPVAAPAPATNESKAAPAPVAKAAGDMSPNEQKAVAFLKGAVEGMGIDVRFETRADDDGIYVNMIGANQGILIGHRGETLDALQYLCSLNVNKGADKYTRITLDTENYRAKREQTLIALAGRMANKVQKSGRRMAMEPMNPYERRIMHSALQGNEYVTTHSEGDEPNRRVVIVPKR